MLSNEVNRVTAEDRNAQGFLCWEETDGHDIIKKYMYANGFLRKGDNLCFGD